MAILRSISNAAKAYSKNEKRDEYDIFGELLAQKLTKTLTSDEVDDNQDSIK